MGGPRLLPILLALAVACGFAAPERSGQSAIPDTFAGRIAALSEPGGYFDTDNLISNERSYLHVVPPIREVPRGGAYVGVGPDTGFSYIAHARPAIAIAIDIRRDNLLLHLLFKALFELAPTRIEYLSLLTGRVAPPDPAAWAARPVDDLVAHVDQARVVSDAALEALGTRLRGAIDAYGIPLADADHQSIARFHGRFVAAGLYLQFNSTGRAPQWNYPTYRDLLLETDRTGVRRSYLASEDDYAFVRSLQARHRVIPVVGDLAGPAAMEAVGRFLTSLEIPVTVFYASNVEFYLFQQGGFGRFVDNLASLPRSPDGLLIRSAFNSIRPDPGYNSASLTQSLDALVEDYRAGRLRTYGAVLSASR